MININHFSKKLILFKVRKWFSASRRSLKVGWVCFRVNSFLIADWRGFIHVVNSALSVKRMILEEAYLGYVFSIAKLLNSSKTLHRPIDKEPFLNLL